MSIFSGIGKVAKKIGKVVSAPARFIGHAAANSGIPLVSNAGGALENVGNAFAGKGSFFGDLGKGAQSAAPLAMFIPGVNALAAGAIAAGASGAGHLLEHGSKTKLSDLAGNAALSGLEAGAGKFALDKLGGVGKLAKSATSKTGVLTKIGTYVRKHPLDAAQMALAGVGTVQGAQRAGKADQMRSDAFAHLDTNPTIDLGALQTDPYSPYKRKRTAPLASMAGGY